MRRERRRVALKRRTRGTEVEIDLRLDGSGRAAIESPFTSLNHLLELLAGHGGMDLKLVQTVNRHADDAYAIDDLATAVAEAMRRALGDRPRIRQFGSEILPVGDALVLAAVDLVSPSVFRFAVSFRSRHLDGMDVALIERFLATFADRLGAGLHVRMLAGNHDENKWRAIFLAVGRSLAQASTEVERDGAREIAADIDYMEGVHRPELVRGAASAPEEAVIEEIEAVGPSAPAESPAEDEAAAGTIGMRRTRWGRRIAAEPRDEIPAERDSGIRGRRDERREARELPELPDLPELPEFPEFPVERETSDLDDAPELMDLGEVGPEGREETAARADADEDEESARIRRRRRGRRGGRGRRRSGGGMVPAGDEGPAPEEVEAGNGRGREAREGGVDREHRAGEFERAGSEKRRFEGRRPGARRPEGRGPEERGPEERGPEGRRPEERRPEERGPGRRSEFPGRPRGNRGPRRWTEGSDSPGRPMASDRGRGGEREDFSPSEPERVSPSRAEAESPPFSRESEHPPFDREEESPSFSREEESPSFSREEELPSFSREEELPPFSREEELPPFARDAEPQPFSRFGRGRRARARTGEPEIESVAPSEPEPSHRPPPSPAHPAPPGADDSEVLDFISTAPEPPPRHAAKPRRKRR